MMINIGELLEAHKQAFEEHYGLKLNEQEQFIFDKAFILGMFQDKVETVKGDK